MTTHEALAIGFASGTIVGLMVAIFALQAQAKNINSIWKHKIDAYKQECDYDG